MLQFVVTGTGRCGTGYAARLFTAAGYTCGHEQWFRARPGIRDPLTPYYESGRTLAGPLLRVREEVLRRRHRLIGDASWLAVPRLPRFKGLVFLQLRHPIDVIRSLHALRFFAPESPGPLRRFAAAHHKLVNDELIDTMTWWSEWNARAAEYADVTYRIEELDAESLAELLARLGATDAPTRATRALASVEPGTNSSKDIGLTPPALGFNDLPDGHAKEELVAAAKRFGYQLT